MWELENDVVKNIYHNQIKELKKQNYFDSEYSTRRNNLEKCVEDLRTTLNYEQNLSLERLLGAIQMYNEYIECKMFGNGMKYMYDLDMCLKNNY